MDLRDKTVLITGATDGVGRRVAERFGEQGAMVLIHGRNVPRAKRTAATIEKSGGKASIHLAELASLDEVRLLADTIKQRTPHLDVLINNAGIGTGPPGAMRETSLDGHELRFAINYLSGFLLSRLLLPLVIAAKGRIVNVASAGQQPIDFTDIGLKRGYSGRRAYCQSKLAQIMFTFDLAQELEGAGVTVNALHPATYMDTTMVRHDGLRPLSSVDEGAGAILHLAVSPDVDQKSGRYFDGTRASRAHAQAYDTDARKRLYLLSNELTGLNSAHLKQR